MNRLLVPGLAAIVLLAGCTTPQEPAPVVPPATPEAPELAKDLVAGSMTLSGQTAGGVLVMRTGGSDCLDLGFADARILAANLTGAWTPENPTVERLRFTLSEDRDGGRSISLTVAPGEVGVFGLRQPLRGPLSIVGGFDGAGQATAAVAQEVSVQVGVLRDGGAVGNAGPC